MPCKPSHQKHSWCDMRLPIVKHCHNRTLAVTRKVTCRHSRRLPLIRHDLSLKSQAIRTTLLLCGSSKKKTSTPAIAYFSRPRTRPSQTSLPHSTNTARQLKSDVTKHNITCGKPLYVTSWHRQHACWHSAWRWLLRRIPHNAATVLLLGEERHSQQS
jgi:hypothetical protein